MQAEQLLELALRKGVEAAEVLQSQFISSPVLFESNRLKQLETIESEVTALRIWFQGRPGLAVAHGDVNSHDLIDRALALSTLNEPEYIELGGSTPICYPDLGQSVGVDKLIDWGKAAIHHIREIYPEVICAADWECETEIIHLLNSHGLDASYRDTTLSCSLAAEWVRGDDFLCVSDGITQRNTLNPFFLAQQVIQRLNWAQENTVTPMGRMPVLFTGKAADLVWGTVQAALNGKQVLEGSSPWSGRIGSLVVSDSITLYQEPDRGPFSCPFDDEGTPTRAINFIEKGILQLFYTDRVTGRRLGDGTTGNGFRPSLSSYPTPGLFNVLIVPGERSLEGLITSMGKGLIVDQILGGGAGISGDFSVNVDLGYGVEQGMIVGRVKDTMVSGNVYVALKNLIEIGADVDWNGNCYTPSLVVEGLSITGKS